MKSVALSMKDACRWVTVKASKPLQKLAAGYVLRFEVSAPARLEIRVSADQQYLLFCDGVLVGRGPEGGDLDNWFWMDHSLKVKPGAHVLSAMVWSWGGKRSAMGQMTSGHGFHLSSPHFRTRRLLGTGLAPWQAKMISGVSFAEHRNVPNGWTGVPPSQIWDGTRFPWEWMSGGGGGWKTALIRSPEQSILTLKPGKLPKPLSRAITGGKVIFVSQLKDKSIPIRQRDNWVSEHKRFQPLVSGESITVPSRTRRRVLVDLGNYFCALPYLTSSGGDGAAIRLCWAESLFVHQEGMEKGQRDEVNGKFFRGIWDVCRLDGGPGRLYPGLSWRAGRFLEILIETADAPVELKLELQETRYPLQFKGGFSCNKKSINRIVPLAIRSLEASAHDHFVDCPYYERLAYAGDGRLEALASYALTGDDVLARKTIELFASSARHNGLCMSRWPSRVSQYIPSFSLWWVCMIHDFAKWRGGKEAIRAVLPPMRSTLDYFLSRLNRDGLYHEKGKVWNFVDWVPKWDFHPQGGTPFSERGVTATVNWILIYTLSLAAEVEEYAGSVRQAGIYRSFAQRIGSRMKEWFWDSSRGLFSDDRRGNSISEHSQIMAILSGQVEKTDAVRLVDALLSTPDRARCSLFFTFYALEAAHQCGLDDLLFEWLKPWQHFVDCGFSTVPENFEDTRSDCHGWGAHALFHLVTSVAGIRPATMGFDSVCVSPRLGALRHLKAACMHPRGRIEVEIEKRSDQLTAMIDLPLGLGGEFRCFGQSYPLQPGRQMLGVTSDPARAERSYYKKPF